ncbi:MAG TPA: MFS transporter, partial [Candidatus Limnocylindrales bacterium]|nr:MFS transporter [Candidatus Limnocylindrales bacterium]
MSATDVPVTATGATSGIGRLGRALGSLTPTGRASVPLSWAFYDFANTIYSYAVVSYAIGLWTVARLGDSDGQFWVLFAGAASVLINAIVSPVLGAMSDRTGGRMRYLLFFTGLTVICSGLIGLVDAAWVGLVLFAIANFGYQAALIYYDATLPVVST